MFFKISYFVIALVLLRKVKYCIDLKYIYLGSFQYSLGAITHMYLYTILQRSLSPMNLLTIIWRSFLHEPLYNSLEVFIPYMNPYTILWRLISQEHLNNSLKALTSHEPLYNSLDTLNIHEHLYNYFQTLTSHEVPL